ncbi:MAG: hypothetical protein AAGF32_03210, partial [Pseudomonadota bacterium]
RDDTELAVRAPARAGAADDVRAEPVERAFRAGFAAAVAAGFSVLVEGAARLPAAFAIASAQK